MAGAGDSAGAAPVPADPWWKLLGYLLRAIYWFHPLLWVAYALLCRDLEAACDESVIRGMTRQERKAYAAALLQCSRTSCPRRTGPLAFGEIRVKERVKSVMRYQKPSRWIVGLAGLLCVLLALCFLTDPKSTEETLPGRPLEELREGYSPEQAAQDGCVVLKQFELLAGEEIWEAFVQRATAGEAAAVRIYQSYPEQTEEYFLQELRYDGTHYWLRYYDADGDGQDRLIEERYPYLNRSISYSVQEQSGDRVEYLLADDPEATAEGYIRALLSSTVWPEETIYDHCYLIYSAEEPAAEGR